MQQFRMSNGMGMMNMCMVLSPAFCRFAER